MREYIPCLVSESEEDNRTRELAMKQALNFQDDMA